tara:strand:+ start:426 stop:1181 length:756 start_codon:yes stop_codon:yes gene_type:complete
MEASSDTANKISQKNGKNFIEHVTNWNNDSKNEIFNSIQYLAMIFIPLLFLNNLIESMIPKLDTKKSNIELLGEILGHSLFLICSVVLLNRIITFFPTYSGRDYDKVSLIEFVLFVVLAVPKISNKSKELFKRLKIAWDGKEEAKKSDTNKQNNQQQQQQQQNIVSVSQPISGGSILAPPQSTKLPPQNPQYQGQHQQMTQQQPPPQQAATSNQIYNNNGFGGLQGAQVPNQMANPEPMAANEGFGAFSSF